MTAKLITRAAPAWLRELATARTCYEESHGWPVDVEVSSRGLRLPVGEVVDAVTMPAALGELVQFQLQVMMLDGPVIAGLRPGRLTFITQPSISPTPLPPDLESAQVRLVRRGERIVLPTSRTEHRLRDVGWLDPPRPGRLPPEWTVVIAAARRVLSSQAAGPLAA